MANAGNHVPLDVLAEDAGSFIEWDADNPDADADADRLGNIQFNLGQHAGLMMKLEGLEQGGLPRPGLPGLEEEYERGWKVLEIIQELSRVSRRLAELGHTGGEANVAHYDEAKQLCLDGLRDIEKQMSPNPWAKLTPPSPGWDGGVSNVNDGPLLPPAKPKPTPRPNPWDKQKGPRPWLNK